MTCSVKLGVTKVIRSAQCPVPSFQWVCGGLGTGYWALGTMQTVWIIDSEQWPRAMLRAELIERGLYAAPIARFVKMLVTNCPLRLMTYRLPSSLLAKTLPIPSIAGALTHHSKPNG